MGIGPREGVLLAANLRRAIVTNGDFTAYVCDSAATRPSSQITSGRLVFVYRQYSDGVTSAVMVAGNDVSIVGLRSLQSMQWNVPFIRRFGTRLYLTTPDSTKH